MAFAWLSATSFQRSAASFLGHEPAGSGSRYSVAVSSCAIRSAATTHNQIIVRSDNYTTFQLGGRAWIKIPSLEPSQRIAIPLDTTVAPTGTLRIILKDADRIEVHYTV